MDLMTVVYAIRILMLHSNEDGYYNHISGGDTGSSSSTCQLLSPHWRIYDKDRDYVDMVDGEGVVGRYLLFGDDEEGYRDDQQDRYGKLHNGKQCSGDFVYQSCANVHKGWFEGRIRLIQANIECSMDPALFIDVVQFDPDVTY